MRGAVVAMLLLGLVRSTLGQSTSLSQTEGVEEVALSREALPSKGNPVLESSSLIAIKENEPRKFKVHDLLTVIVREHTDYEAEATANARRQANLKSELDAFIKFTGAGVGASVFRRGKPNIEYKGTFNQRNDGESEREDSLTTRITADIIDVKPNGNLVFEAKRTITHDREVHVMTLTGTCRSLDVTPDNTVLSTQVADKVIEVHTKGNIRDATRSGWLGKLYDLVRPL